MRAAWSCSPWGSAGWSPAAGPGGTAADRDAAAVARSHHWLLVAPWRLRAGDVRRGGAPIALLLLFACWISLYELRKIDIPALIAALMIVWVADVGAYFVGKGFGRRKLAPVISPGKSVEGAVGGALLVAIIGLISAPAPALRATLPAELVSGWGPVLAVAVLMALAALSVVGDLHESLLKRQARVKDSGWLLPGHGGVLDRIDALIPCMPVVLLLHWSLAP
ncbi:MAG: phosphatidate cytidylyltransferase [Burkholderiaceae bacterium]